MVTGSSPRPENILESITELWRRLDALDDCPETVRRIDAFKSVLASDPEFEELCAAFLAAENDLVLLRSTALDEIPRDWGEAWMRSRLAAKAANGS